ncbi:MAG: glycosyltransferase [Bacilli bacterium]|nr:glycosyltransferase [Bacilli bacterium]
MLIKKICVYAICKNEEQFVDRWYEAIKEADGIYVLDTGSTDNTVEKLKSHNIHVETKEIKPWRFDIARNLSLDLVPTDTDICICLDLDEIMEPGWKEKIEKLWQPNTTRLRYIYNWYIDENGNPKIVYYAEKIHARNGFHWVNPVHEILEYEKTENQIFTDDLVINHYPDRTKSRSSYLPLLELAVKENPNNDRNVHYLGREYMYYEKYNEAIDTLIKHLQLPNATWKDERCASMRFIARCYQNLNRFDEAQMWLNKAIDECPYLRDPLVEMALLYYQKEDWNQVIIYGEKALTITKNEKTYINELFSWDETINDMLSIAYYQQNNLKKAIQNAEMALLINPQNERIKSNLKLFQSIEKNCP